MGVLEAATSILVIEWLELGRLILRLDPGRTRKESSWYLDGIRAEAANSSACNNFTICDEIF